mmetsp:Transcript_45256/g.104983  ORF Transcript_45256/g.104983 Transcript_45256/m.104983 type:complete len:373 (-) Transcript_45256:27-1145(-)
MVKQVPHRRVQLEVVLALVCIAPVWSVRPPGASLLAERAEDAGQACGQLPCSPCSALLEANNCKWKFKQYIASELEEKWWQVVDRVGDNPCDAVRTTFAEYFARYKAAIHAGRLASNGVIAEGQCNCLKSAEPESFDQTVFSRFEYENECTSEMAYSYIEPLAGILRHPEVCEHEKQNLLRKDWLLVDQWALQKNRNLDSRFFYFDAGASTWAEGLGGASQAWFDSIYVNKCAPFQGYWLWEVLEQKPSKVFGALPARVKPNYHWYNIPASQDKENSDSPLFHVRNTAQPQDFVVLKIDIDNNPVEEAMVYALLNDTHLLSLIDEFYWEHHINMYPMTKHWHDTISKTHKQKDSIMIFRKLREAGVRAHSWV